MNELNKEKLRFMLKAINESSNWQLEILNTKPEDENFDWDMLLEKINIKNTILILIELERRGIITMKSGYWELNEK